MLVEPIGNNSLKGLCMLHLAKRLAVLIAMTVGFIKYRIILCLPTHDAYKN